MDLTSDFFPALSRRATYSRKPNGSFYADYARYRAEIAEDCRYRCVYCDAHQEEIGGERAMQLDHFRPKSVAEFRHLENDPRNLLYACFVCNAQKSDFWPSKSTEQAYEDGVGFLDPFVDDRQKFFDCPVDGRLIAKADPAGYLIRLLLLNRTLLRKIRQLRHLRCIVLRNRPRIWKWVEDLRAGRVNLDREVAVQIISTLMKLLEASVVYGYE